MFGLDDAAAGAVLAAGISSVAGLIGGAVNRRAEKRLANQQLDKNYELWKEQQFYNSPAEQASRLKNAGLNPALAYGGSGQVVGNADPAPNLDYSGAINTPVFDANSAIQFGMSSAQLAQQFKVQDSQIEMNKANALKLRSDAATSDALRDPQVKQLLSQNALNIAKQNESYKAAEVLMRQADLLLYQKDLTSQEIRGYELSNEYASRTMEFRVAAADLNNKEALSRIKVNNSLSAKYGEEINQIIAETKVAVAREMNIKQDTELKTNQTLEAKFNARVIQASEARVKALTEQIQKQTQLTEKQINWFTADHICSYFGTVGQVVTSGMNSAASMAMAGMF